MNRGVDERDETRDEREERDETRRMAMTSIERARRRARRSCETVDGSDRSIARDRGVGSGDGSGLKMCPHPRRGGWGRSVTGGGEWRECMKGWLTDGFFVVMVGIIGGVQRAEGCANGP